MFQEHEIVEMENGKATHCKMPVQTRSSVQCAQCSLQPNVAVRYQEIRCDPYIKLQTESEDISFAFYR